MQRIQTIILIFCLCLSSVSDSIVGMNFSDEYCLDVEYEVA